MEKKFLSYLPARLVKCPSRWYIDFHQTDPNSGIRKRHLKTFELNRINDKRIRIRKANEILRELNDVLLPQGYPYIEVRDKDVLQTKLQRTPLLEAVEIGYQQKIKSGKRNTIKSYKTPKCHFIQFLEKNNLASLRVSEFTQHMSFLFVDYLELELKVKERAFNNYIRMLRGMFKHLVKRQYILDNPFQEIEYKKQPTKSRRNFSEEEKKWMFKYLHDNDPALFRLVLLMYFCALRIEDCQNLKLQWLDLKRGLIVLPASITKNKDDNCKTIPKSIQQYFYEKDFIEHPGYYYAFSKDALLPGQERSSQNLPYNQHRKALLEMIKEIDTDINGLSLYSWRDTGATDHLASISNPLFVQDQFNHSDLKTTMIYRHRDPVNEAFRNLPFEL